MARGRHTHRRRFRTVAILATVLGVLLLTAGGAAYAAYRYESARSDRILPGVAVAGVDVGDMTRQEALAAVRAEASAELDRRLVVSADDKHWNVTHGELGERAAIESAVDEAVALTTSYGTFDRFWHRFRDEPVDAAFDLDYRIGGDAVDRLVQKIAKSVFVPAVDAAFGMTPDANGIDLTYAKTGQKLDAEAAVETIRAAVEHDRAKVELSMRPVRPKVTQDSMGPTIVVHVDRNQLELYDGFDLVHTWSVATAKPGYTTPTGVWSIWDKRENPTWYNPALDSWGAGLPAVIPGGPGNPMGTRAIYIDAPGLIRIHGTTDPASIGRYASHGCIRMFNEDVEKLFDVIPVGAHVVVVGHRPAWAQEWDVPRPSDI
jgi:lipoprotein-anchoring transpeptidase ErfK/SrfK